MEPWPCRVTLKMWIPKFLLCPPSGRNWEMDERRPLFFSPMMALMLLQKMSYVVELVDPNCVRVCVLCV